MMRLRSKRFWNTTSMHARPPAPLVPGPSATDDARQRTAGQALEDWLALASAGLALLLAGITALAHVSLRQNPQIAAYVAFDATIVLYLTVALTMFQRRRGPGAFLALLIANGALGASCAKTMILGEPGLFADILLIPDLLRVSDPLLAWGAVALATVLAVAFLVNLAPPRNAREVALLVPLLGAVLLMVGVSLAPGLAHATVEATPVQGRAFPVFGHFYTAYTNLVRDADWTHTVEELRADASLEPPIDTLPEIDLRSIAQRNLHIIILESFTDPAWYPRFGLEDVRLPPLFERWRRAPRSTALSPVFGNRSSNAEFEILCGVPAAAGPSDVIFWRLPERELPCLPNLLGERGYRTTALHPSPPRTFNLSEAYPALGFDDPAFASDLDMTDRDGQFLSAKATLAQHWARVKPLIDGDRPVLSYVFVNASHFPYDRNEDRRPDRWHPAGASEQVTDYMNAVHYLAVATGDFVSRLLRHDPESLIVVVGDHAPALGADFGGQREGGLISAEEPDPFGRAILYEVPLILLDRGELVPLGRLPTYLIPYAVVDRLVPGNVDGAWDGPWRLRPFRDRAILVERDGPGEIICSVQEPTDDCRTSARQAQAWQVDLFDMIDETRPGGDAS
jgi:phosphoglycerol transferase MdoB-like AlkP superfamily enzyme